MTIPASAVAIAFVVTVCLIALLLVWEQYRHRQFAKLDRMYHDRELRRETARHCEKVRKAA